MNDVKWKEYVHEPDVKHKAGVTNDMIEQFINADEENMFNPLEGGRVSKDDCMYRAVKVDSSLTLVVEHEFDEPETVGNTEYTGIEYEAELEAGEQLIVIEEKNINGKVQYGVIEQAQFNELNSSLKGEDFNKAMVDRAFSGTHYSLINDPHNPDVMINRKEHDEQQNKYPGIKAASKDKEQEMEL